MARRHRVATERTLARDREESKLARPRMSTVGLVERYTRVTAENDVDKDVHLQSSGNLSSTLCGMRPGAVTTRDVSCYRCHQFSVGGL
jgi:ethanolamine ammonia-lyase small subunit